MISFIWATLLFSVRSSNADTGASVEKQFCDKKFCISLIEGEITAEAGLCVVIPCSFTTDSDFKPQSIVWFKCEPVKKRCIESDMIFHSNNNKKVQSAFRERVSLLETDLSQNNCSIIINDLKESDSGSYQLRVNGLISEKQDGFTFFPKANVSVKGQKPTVKIPPLTEGNQTTLSCTAPGLCSGSVPEITWTWRGAGVNDSHITGNITDFKTENLTAVTQRHSSTLTFDPSAEHHGTKVTCKVRFTGDRTTEETVTLNVSYLQKPVITGMTTVKEGDDLNVTCSAESFPPSIITWTKHGSNKTLQNGTATLFITNVTTEDSGQYICTAELKTKALTTHCEVTVTFSPKILKNDSGCVNQSDVLTCVCISEGFPLPTITWPLLENHTEYSVITTVSHHTVNSSISLNLTAHSKTTFECVSSNDNGQTEQSLSMKNDSKEENTGYYTHLKDLVTTIKWLQVIPAFFTGILLSAIFICLARKCNRNKHKSSVNVAENVEMVTTQAVPLVDADQAIADDGPHDQEAAEGAEAAWPSVPGEDDVKPKEVEYTDIDVFKLKRKSPMEAKETQEIADTEYAEIKKETTMERQDNGIEEGDMLGDNEEAPVMIRQDKEAEECILAEEERGEDVPLYSNVNEIMGQI